MMTRLMLMIACCSLSVACNLSDPIDGPPANVNNENNQSNQTNNTMTNNTVPDMDNGDTGGDGLTITFSEVRINDEEVPTSASAQTPLNFEADVLVDGATGNLQLVIYIDDAEPACLYEGTPGEAAVELDVAGEIAGSDEVEVKELLYEAFELADCDAALAAATGEGEIIGEVTFTDPPPLQVIAVTPTDLSDDVVVDTTVRISFNAPLDAGSVTGRVQLSSPAGQVPATVNVMNDEIIVTPTADLTEFQTVYTVAVSGGITGSGRSLEQPFSSSFRTRMFVPNVFYAASNEFHGVGFSLGIDDANQCLVMPADDTAPRQRFRFVPSGDGWVGYNSLAIAAGRALDGGDGSTANACAMRPLGATPMPAQVWSFAPTPAAGAFFIQNARFNEAQSLDGTNIAPSMNPFPLMQPTTDVPRQRWRWRRLPDM